MAARTSDRQALGRVLTMLLPLLFVFLLGGIIGISVVPGSAQPLHDPAWFYDHDCGDLEEPLASALPAAFTWEHTPISSARLPLVVPGGGGLSAALASAFLRRAPPPGLGIL
jgi:hypothetical protein